MKKVSPAIDLLLPSAKLVRDNLPVFAILLVLPMLLSSFTGEVSELPQQPTWQDIANVMREMITPYVVAGTILSALFYPPLAYAQLQAAKKGTVTLRQAFSGSRKYYFRLWGTTIAVGAIALGGLMLLIIPGIIALRSFILAPYYLIDKNLGIREALKLSLKESRKYKWPIYGILGVMALFGLLSSFGTVGLISGTILTTLYTVAFALRYEEIKTK